MRIGIDRTATDRPGRLEARRAWPMLALLCAVQWVDVLGTTIVIVALPSIQRDLGMSGAVLELSAGIYALVFGGLIITTGRLSDVFGPRRLFRLGLGLFCAASLLCGLAVSAPMLIGARALEGLGAALAIPAALTMVTDLFPEGPRRHRALGIWTATAAGGGIAGFALGGLITELAGWRWIFLINVPVGLIALAVLPRLAGDRWGGGQGQRVAPAGAVLLIGGLFALLCGLTLGKERGFAATETWTVTAGGVILLGLFTVVERWSRSPLIAPELRRSRTLLGASLVAFALTATTGAAAVMLTLFMQGQLGLSPVGTGVMLAPGSVAVVVGSIAGARATDRFGFGASMSLGMAGVAAAMALDLAGVTLRNLPLLVGGLALAGAALGCASVASTAGGLAGVDVVHKGLASGVLNATAKLGTALGIALIPAIGAAWVGVSSLASAVASSDLTAGLRVALAAAGIVALLAIPVAWSSFPGSGAAVDDRVRAGRTPDRSSRA